MFIYQKKLQYPVRIKNTNPALAAQIISQYGGPKCKEVQSPGKEAAFQPGGLDPDPVPGDKEGLHALQAFHQRKAPFLS